MNIGNRIKQIRKSKKITQAEFGEKIGFKQTAIGQFENGTRGVSDRTIMLLCQAYSVNEEWLRNGTGEMFINDDNALVASLAQQYGLDDIGRKIIETYIKLPESQRMAINGFVQNLVDSLQPSQAIPLKVEPTPPKRDISNIPGKVTINPIAARSKDDRPALPREIDEDVLDRLDNMPSMQSDDEI